LNEPKLTARQPSEDLKGFTPLLQRIQFAATAAACHRLPAPFVPVGINMGELAWWRRTSESSWRRYPRLFLQGLCTSWAEVFKPGGGEADYLIAILEPWAVEPLFGLKPEETVDQLVDLSDALPGWSARFIAALERAQSSHDKLSALDNALVQLLPKKPLVPQSDLRWFMDVSRAHAGAIPVGQIAGDLGRSTRYLRAVCKRSLGVTPKQWSIIERFAANLRRLHPDPWQPKLPVDPDYCDQAHEIHEFKRMSGVTPSVYRAEKARGDSRLFSTRCLCSQVGQYPGTGEPERAMSLGIGFDGAVTRAPTHDPAAG
jgi:AraC-like DNA-binding protein